MTLTGMMHSKVIVTTMMQSLRMFMTKWRVTQVRQERIPWIKMMTVKHLHRSVTTFLTF